MKKVVVKLNSFDEQIFFLLEGVIKKNPMQAVSSIQGIVSMELDPKDNKITIVGDVDPVVVVKKLKKWQAKIDTVGPAKEEKKPEKPPADDKKKDLTEEEKWAIFLQQQAYWNHHHNYNAHYAPPFYVSYDENPNKCVTC